MLTVERVVPPPGVAAELARRGGGSPLAGIVAQRLTKVGLLLALVFGAIGLLDALFGLMQPTDWLVLIVGAAILTIPVTVLSIGGEKRAARTHRTSSDGMVTRCTLDRGAEHWFVEHEHGVLLLSPADAKRTLCLDILSVADDPRWDAFRAGTIHRKTWRWYGGEGGAVAGFAAEGEALPPNSLARAAGHEDPDTAAAIFEWLGSPADGDVIARPFAKVDAFIRKALSTP